MEREISFDVVISDIHSINKKFSITLDAETNKKMFLTKEEELELIEKAKNGCQRSVKALVENLTPFIYNLAKHFTEYITSKNLSADTRKEELLSCGTIGVLKAIKKFDKSRGFRLCAIAKKFIQDEFKQGYRNRKLDNDYIARMEESIKDVSTELSVSDFDAHRYLKIFDNGISKNLLNKNFPNISKDIIIGAGFSNIEEIKKNIELLPKALKFFQMIKIDKLKINDDEFKIILDDEIIYLDNKYINLFDQQLKIIEKKKNMKSKLS